MTKKESESLDINQVKSYLAGGYDETNGRLTTELLAANLKSGMQPKCIVEYDRCAFVEPAGNVRITFDREIRAGGNAGSFLTGKAACTPLKETDRILEVKYDEMLPGFIGRLLELGNMNQVSYSKYRLGREQLEVQRKCLRRM